MKKIATILCLLTALGLNAQTSTQSFTSAAGQAQARLEKALAELDQIQKEVNELRPKLGAELDDVEGTALRLRDEASNATRLKAGVDLEVSGLNKEKESVIENNNYIKSTLLNEYIRRLETTIDASELPLYQEKIRNTISFLEDDASKAEDATIFRAQLEVIKIALDRLQKIIGGETFAASAIVNNTLKQGQFLLVGPVSYFTTGEESGITNGMQKNFANIYVLENYGATIASTINSGSGIIPVDTTDGEALEGITHDISLMEEFKLGGFVMFPILGLFVLAILIAAFKAVELFRVKAANAKDIDVILDHLRAGKNDAAMAHAKSVGGPVGEMLSAAVENADQDREVIEEVLYETIIKTQPRLERFLAFIAVVAATAPLLGLLGTVTGMIKTFKLITIVGTGDARNLSSGISEALITTKWGLIVAIPTLIMHALLNRKAKSVVGSMEQAAVSFMNGVAEMRGEPVQE